MDERPFPIEQHLAHIGYKALPPFVIIDEHEHVREDGKGVERFDRPRLERLAAKLNGKSYYQNTPMPAVVGHTTPGGPEERQPHIRGWVTRYWVGDFFDENGRKKAAIYGRPWAAPGEEQTFKKYPHRSIELWTGGEHGDDIHPLALLGPTAPRRNLGVHLFSRDESPGRYHYSREAPMNDFNFLPAAPGAAQPNTGSTAGMRVSDMTVDQLGQALAPVLAKSSEFSGLFQLRDEVSQLLDSEAQEWEPGGFDQGGMGQMGGQPGMGFDPYGGGGGYDQGQMAGAGMGGGYPQQYARAPQQPLFDAYGRPVPVPPPAPGPRRRGPVRYSREHLQQYAPSAFQTGGTYTAAGLPTQYTPPPGTKLETVPLPELPPGDPYKAHFDRLFSLLNPLAEKAAAAEKALQLGDKVDADLRKLATEHRVRFDYAREKQVLLGLPDDKARGEHIQAMLTFYQKGEPLPGQGGFPVPPHQMVGTAAPAPQHGHQLTVGAMLPGQVAGGAPMMYARQGGFSSVDRAYDEADVVPGMDAFTLAANARANKMSVEQYVAALKTGGGSNGAGAVEKVR